MGCSDKPIINVLNKCDKAENEVNLSIFENSVRISALNGDGIDELLQKIGDTLPKTRKRVKLLLPFDKIKYSVLVRDNGVVHSEEYVENGLLMDATVEVTVLDELKDYIVLSLIK